MIVESFCYFEWCVPRPGGCIKSLYTPKNQEKCSALISFVLLLYLVVIVIYGFWVVIDTVTAYEITIIDGSPTVVTTVVCTSDYMDVWISHLCV